MLKMINFDYQVVINTSKIDFNSVLDVLNKNSYNTNNLSQKNIINQYKEYLYSLSKNHQIYSKSFYIAVRKLKRQEEEQLIEAFRVMRHMGINISKVTKEEKIYSILYENINRISKVGEENESF